MTYINITRFVLINYLDKDHNMIETSRLKKFLVFMEIILSFVLSRKIINIYNDIVRNLETMFSHFFKYKKPEQKVKYIHRWTWLLKPNYLPHWILVFCSCGQRKYLLTVWFTLVSIKLAIMDRGIEFVSFFMIP